MILILDGYNVIHAAPELARHLDRSLEAARAALIVLCRDYLARRGDLEQVSVVFDGNDACAQWPQTDHGGVRVIFTQHEEEADERILRLIRAKIGRNQFIVVSNDTHIFNNARVHGARAISVQEFLAQAHPTRTTRSKQPTAPEKAPLSTRDAQQITDDYWKYLEGKAQRGASARPPSSRRLHRE